MAGTPTRCPPCAATQHAMHRKTFDYWPRGLEMAAVVVTCRCPQCFKPKESIVPKPESAGARAPEPQKIPLDNGVQPPQEEGFFPIETERSGPRFTTKDSGQRAEFASGMVRDTEDGKPRFDLIRPLNVPYRDQPLTRLAELMARGASKYGDRNWEKGASEAELARARSSFSRHAEQALAGERDEDHWAAVLFNAIQIMTLEWKLAQAAEREVIFLTGGAIHLDDGPDDEFDEDDEDDDEF